MIEQLAYIESNQTVPYRNLAAEEYLLLHCKPHQCILYLWQNRRTVVIGRNQNAWNECRAEALTEDGGFLARRLSGGGAVYHDLGNLNFTFLVGKEDYDIGRQLSVIIRAMELLGLHAEKSGRNDILIDGRKFSGNAFYEQETHCYHHGTIMMDVNKETLSKYLTVSAEKLKSKGVSSVRSRVTNLREHLPALTLSELKEALRRAFEEVYGHNAETLSFDALPEKAISEREAFFSSWDWLYGRKIPFQHELSARFPWGGINIQLAVSGGQVTDAAVYSDALCPRLIERIPPLFCEARYEREALFHAMTELPAEHAEEAQIKEDLLSWFRTAEL